MFELSPYSVTLINQQNGKLFREISLFKKLRLIFYSYIKITLKVTIELFIWY